MKAEQLEENPADQAAADGNGNFLTDNLNNIYTWSVYGSPSKINSTTLIYDALGRMVEQQNGSTNTEILYSQLGKTALMNGSTLVKAFVPLPGGGTAIYNSSGTLAYYRHPDWLGSSRLTSTVTAPTSMYSDVAYAPYGEQYSQAGTADPSFTGQNSDTTSSLYDFTFREHSMSQGRWISPDPAGLAAVDPTNPQSWNRYAYVTNDPLALVDPSGLDDGIYDGSNCELYVYRNEGSSENPNYVWEGQLCGGNGGSSNQCYYFLNNPCGGLRGNNAKHLKQVDICNLAQRARLLVQTGLSLYDAAGKFSAGAVALAGEPLTFGLDTPVVLYGFASGYGNVSAFTSQFNGVISGNIAQADHDAMWITNRTTVGGLGGLLFSGGNEEAGATGAALESMWSAGYNGGKLGSLFGEAASAFDKFLAGSSLANSALDALGIKLTCNQQNGQHN